MNEINLLEEIKTGLENIRATVDGSQPIDTVGATMAIDSLLARVDIALIPCLETQIAEYKPEWKNLIACLIPRIADDYRASDDPEDTEPGMCLTIGFTPATPDKDASWSYQTGDNSYTGGAYGHAHWAVVSLYRDTPPEDVVDEIIDQLSEVIFQ